MVKYNTCKTKRNFILFFLLILIMIVFQSNAAWSSSRGHHFFSGIVNRINHEGVQVSGKKYLFDKNLKVLEHYKYKNSFYEKSIPLQKIQVGSKIIIKAIGKHVQKIYLENY